MTTPRLPLVGDHAAGGLDAVGRVVVVRVVGGRADVDHVVTGRGQLLDQVGLQLEARVVRSEVNAHDGIMPALASSAG
jgi:hypothetical protein